MEIIKSLGELLADQISISPTAARGLIKLALKDELGPFTNLNKVNFNDMQKTISNSFKKRLDNLSIQNVEEITESMLSQLKHIQSLITMAKV
jgi:hypothetical protein